MLSEDVICLRCCKKAPIAEHVTEDFVPHPGYGGWERIEVFLLIVEALLEVDGANLSAAAFHEDMGTEAMSSSSWLCCKL
jgi:hypothetical protein